MGRKNESMTIAINAHQKKLLEDLAMDHGLFHHGKPNVSGLIQSIALKELILYDPANLSKVDKRALKKQLKALQTQLTQMIIEL